MKITRSQIIALAASILLVLWFVFNNISDGPIASTVSSPKPSKDAALPTVLVAQRTASQRQPVLELFGQTEANRQVRVKANTASVVTHTPLREGQIVNKRDVMCVQSVNERDARVEQAKAQLTRADLEYQAAVKLAERGFRSETQVASLKANVDAATASLKAAEVERSNVNMLVPFRGIFEHQDAHVGDFLSAGQACGLVVELDPLIVAVQLTENQVGSVKTGQTANITLATGETVTGTLRRIEALASANTRSFRSEVTVPNPKMALKAGVTANVRLSSKDTLLAQHIPAGILALNDAGDIGVRYVDDNDYVHFAVTTTIDEDETGVWVTGLPEYTRIIIKGQDFVSSGTKVSTTIDSSLGQ
ncbi:MAG: efflux RND transporter periplasmic adaptor subunit [Maricaulaceae bacterium]